MPRICRSRYAGQWYPEDQSQLESLLRESFIQSERRTGPVQSRGEFAFIVPHAAPQYSGTVAAAAYRRVASLKPQSIVLLGFSHFTRHSGILIPEANAYRTPLGDIAIHCELRDACLREDLFAIGDLADHSVEIQLPFLQLVAPAASVLPLYVGPLSRNESTQAARSLSRLVEPRTVLVASTDFTHYGPEFGYTPFPLDEDTPQRLQSLDHRLIESIGALDPNNFFALLLQTGSNMCGFMAVNLLMEWMHTNAQTAQQKVLDYQTSGEITGNYGHSVSYAALAYSR
ncbi:MAG TPA: AmmeMemoRadiSam system protein B [Bryobacteraceae bacterium]|nr:AmmeMemoRadiSam system protein B [Bryobacteraceae bacterium]